MTTWRRWPPGLRLLALVLVLGSVALSLAVVFLLIPPRLTLRIETDPPGAEVRMGEYRLTNGVAMPTPLLETRSLGASPQEVEIPLKRHPLFRERVLGRLFPFLIRRPAGVYSSLTPQSCQFQGTVVYLDLLARDWVPEMGNTGIAFVSAGRPLRIAAHDWEASSKGYAWRYRAVVKVRLEPAP